MKSINFGTAGHLGQHFVYFTPISKTCISAMQKIGGLYTTCCPGCPICPKMGKFEGRDNDPTSPPDGLLSSQYKLVEANTPGLSARVGAGQARGGGSGARVKSCRIVSGKSSFCFFADMRSLCTMLSVLNRPKSGAARREMAALMPANFTRNDPTGIFKKMVLIIKNYQNRYHNQNPVIRLFLRLNSLTFGLFYASEEGYLCLE